MPTSVRFVDNRRIKMVAVCDETCTMRNDVGIVPYGDVVNQWNHPGASQTAKPEEPQGVSLREEW